MERKKSRKDIGWSHTWVHQLTHTNTYSQQAHKHTHIVLMRAHLRSCYTGAHMKTKTYDIIFFGVRRWRWRLGYLVPAMWNKYHLYDIRLLLPFLFFCWYISYHAEIRVAQRHPIKYKYLLIIIPMYVSIIARKIQHTIEREINKCIIH